MTYVRCTLRLALLAGVFAAAPLTAQQSPTAPDTTDARVGLTGGLIDAKAASKGLKLVSATPRPADFYTPGNPGSFANANSDLAFQGKLVFQGNFNGFQIWDVSDPKAPTLRASKVCPGGQGDVSVLGKLLFMSVEETRGRVDCGTQGVATPVSAERFRGVRIFDISNLDAITQVAAVQTCRGSHTHTLVSDPKDKAHIYVYVQGTGGVRAAEELPGCSRGGADDTTSSRFRIEVIKVPLAKPAEAKIVAAPRIFADQAGAIAGLNPGGRPDTTQQRQSETDQCHDITAYPAIGLAAGACSGNGILLDISNPASPKRIDEVMDLNFAYWHSATFNNAGTTVLFTDEWGGGTSPRCRVTDKPTWGANAIFALAKNRKLQQLGYFKLPAPQTAQENCVAHNGSLIPVPGRDVMVQAWYQGGISVLDYTDPTKPAEIAYFDRGPVDPTKLTLGGQWSTYWYNGLIYGSEIARGLDILELEPSALLTQNEIDAAKTVQFAEANPQHQEKLVWPASFALARAYLDQLGRSKGLGEQRIQAVRMSLQQAEKVQGGSRRTMLTTLATALGNDAKGSSDAAKVTLLQGAVRDLARGR